MLYSLVSSLSLVRKIGGSVHTGGYLPQAGDMGANLKANCPWTFDQFL